MDEAYVRYIPLRKAELLAMKKLYEKVMSAASYGLFFRTGQIFGAQIVRRVAPNKAQYFESTRQVLIMEQWVRDIKYQHNTIMTQGSIEVYPNQRPTCHILRGIISKIFEGYYGRRFYCHEKGCESRGEEMCIFEVRPVERKGV